MPTESAKGEKAEKEEKDEQYMSSKQWLAVYGLEARKLNLYNILSGLAFKHQDGVVEVMERPTNDQTDAVSRVFTCCSGCWVLPVTICEVSSIFC